MQASQKKDSQQARISHLNDPLCLHERGETGIVSQTGPSSMVLEVFGRSLKKYKFGNSILGYKSVENADGSAFQSK
jgi:hypothetical protein